MTCSFMIDGNSLTISFIGSSYADLYGVPSTGGIREGDLLGFAEQHFSTETVNSIVSSFQDFASDGGGILLSIGTSNGPHAVLVNNDILLMISETSTAIPYVDPQTGQPLGVVSFEEIRAIVGVNGMN